MSSFWEYVWTLIYKQYCFTRIMFLYNFLFDVMICVFDNLYYTFSFVSVQCLWQDGEGRLLSLLYTPVWLYLYTFQYLCLNKLKWIIIFIKFKVWRENFKDFANIWFYTWYKTYTSATKNSCYPQLITKSIKWNQNPTSVPSKNVLSE